MEIDGLKTRGDLSRFVRDEVQRPGTLGVQHIGGMGAFAQARVARGSTTLTGTGAANATVVVTHGLTDSHGAALIPSQILITTDTGTILATVTARTATTFTLSNQDVGGAGYAAAVRNDWIAIG